MENQLESSHNTKILTNLGGHILSPALYLKRGQNMSAKICQKFLYCDFTYKVLKTLIILETFKIKNIS